MNICRWRYLPMTVALLTLAGCTSKETKEALQKATDQVSQKQYQDANTTLVEALRAREAKIRAENPPPANATENQAVTTKVENDSEILRMERAQIPVYLHIERADLASAVYSDILLGSPGDRVVYTALADPDPVIRAGALHVLGLAGKPEAIDAIVGLVKDPDQQVRRAAVAALGMIKDPRTVDPLLSALKDSYWFVRSDAAEALGLEHDQRAVPGLLDAVADSDSTVEISAESALVMLCTVPGAPADEYARRLSDPNPKLVVLSAVCLGLLKDPRAVPPLIRLASSTDADTRLHAVKALGETGDRSAIPTLRETLKDLEVNVRGWSIIGLDKLNDLGSLEVLRAMAGDANETPAIRSAAQTAVTHILGPTPARTP